MSTEIEKFDDTLRISRHFNAPRQRVFAAWSDANQIDKWWGCAQTTSVQAEIDFRVGGKFRFHMIGTSYGEMDFCGTYQEIVSPEKIVYTVEFPTPNGPMEMRVQIELLEEDGGTKLIMTQTGFPMPELKDIIAGGTTQSLDKLEKLVCAEPATA